MPSANSEDGFFGGEATGESELNSEDAFFPAAAPSGADHEAAITIAAEGWAWALDRRRAPLPRDVEPQREDLAQSFFLTIQGSPRLVALSMQDNAHRTGVWYQAWRHLWIDVVGRRRRCAAARLDYMAPEALPEAADPGRAPDEVLASNEGLLAVRRALDGLSKTTRDALLLRFVDGLHFDQIATRVKKSSGSLRTAVSRAYDRLAQDGRLREVAA